jgi:hypothetical protein
VLGKLNRGFESHPLRQNFSTLSFVPFPARATRCYIFWPQLHGLAQANPKGGDQTWQAPSIRGARSVAAWHYEAVRVGRRPEAAKTGTYYIRVREKGKHRYRFDPMAHWSRSAISQRLGALYANITQTVLVGAGQPKHNQGHGNQIQQRTGDPHKSAGCDLVVESG